MVDDESPSDATSEEAASLEDTTTSDETTSSSTSHLDATGSDAEVLPSTTPTAGDYLQCAAKGNKRSEAAKNFHVSCFNNVTRSCTTLPTGNKPVIFHCQV